MMKRTLTLLCLMLGSQISGCASLANAAEQQQRTYVYCNVYAASACFGVASGDVMTMRVPIDFVTYDLVLLAGQKVSIYSGYNPPRASARDGSRAKTYSIPSGNYEYALTSDGKHVITYTPIDTGAPLLQVVVDQVEVSKQPRLVDFLSAFRSCKSEGHGVFCDKEAALFKDVIQDVFEDQRARDK